MAAIGAADVVDFGSGPATDVNDAGSEGATSPHPRRSPGGRAFLFLSTATAVGVGIALIAVSIWTLATTLSVDLFAIAASEGGPTAARHGGSAIGLGVAHILTAAAAHAEVARHRGRRSVLVAILYALAMSLFLFGHGTITFLYGWHREHSTAEWLRVVEGAWDFTIAADPSAVCAIKGDLRCRGLGDRECPPCVAVVTDEKAGCASCPCTPETAGMVRRRCDRVYWERVQESKWSLTRTVFFSGLPAIQPFSKKSLSHGMQQSSDPTVETHRISSFFRDRKTTWPMFQGHGPCKPLRSILYPTVVSSKMQARLS